MKNKAKEILEQYEQDNNYLKMKRELLILFGVSGSSDDIPLKEKHFKFIVKFPTKRIEFKEISENTETTKNIDLLW